VAEGSDKDDKTEEASARKLEEARKKGDVAKSGDVPLALSLIGACVMIAFYGPQAAMTLASGLVPFIAHPNALLDSLEGDGGLSLAYHLVMMMLPPLMIIMGVGILFGVMGNLMQTGLLFTTQKLKFDFGRLNPVEGFKRLFGLDALVEFLKTVIKLTITALIVYLVLQKRAAEISGLAALSPLSILVYTREVFIAMAMAVCLFLLTGALFDYGWQKFRFLQRMKMSKQEVKEEYKQAEGDPHVKAKLKQLRAEKSRQRMMANLKKATVIITNPTHYAVALAYKTEEHAAPVCVAKGVDALALKIREEAAKLDIPIIEDPPLARSLYASLDIDEVIKPEFFAAVSKIIGFVMSRRRRGF
jgi:flagellar biosynthesis protein FlhB